MVRRSHKVPAWVGIQPGRELSAGARPGHANIQVCITVHPNGLRCVSWSGEYSRSRRVGEDAMSQPPPQDQGQPPNQGQRAFLAHRGASRRPGRPPVRTRASRPPGPPGTSAVLALGRPACADIAAAVVAVWRAEPGSAAGLASWRSATLSRSWLHLRLWSAAAEVQEEAPVPRRSYRARPLRRLRRRGPRRHRQPQRGLDHAVPLSQRRPGHRASRPRRERSVRSSTSRTAAGMPTG